MWIKLSSRKSNCLSVNQNVTFQLSLITRAFGLKIISCKPKVLIKDASNFNPSGSSRNCTHLLVFLSIRIVLELAQILEATDSSKPSLQDVLDHRGAARDHNFFITYATKSPTTPDIVSSRCPVSSVNAFRTHSWKVVILEINEKKTRQNSENKQTFDLRWKKWNWGKNSSKRWK